MAQPQTDASEWFRGTQKDNGGVFVSVCFEGRRNPAFECRSGEALPTR